MEQRVTAQALFDRGRDLLKAGRAEEACPLLEESLRIERGLGALFNLGDCYERIGRFASAHVLFLEVAARARSTQQRVRYQVARERAESVSGRLSRLTVRVSPGQPSGLRIERDGAAVSQAQWGVAVPVDPGSHRVQASAPGHAAWTRSVQISPEPSEDIIDIPVLQPLSRKPSFFEPLEHKLGVAAVSTGAIALGTAAYFGVRAWSKNADSNRLCDGARCQSLEGVELREEARRFGDLTTWASVTGLALTGAGLSLFWFAGDATPPDEKGPQQNDEASLLVRSARGGATVQWLGSF